MRTNVKKITVIAMLCALAYMIVFLVRIPVVMFLKYEPKDVVITIGGFLYGPLTAFVISAAVSLAEMVTISETGPIGALMNVVASCAFACTASLIYKKHRTMKGAVAGLAAGWITATVVMLMWNYFIVPIYMGLSREAVAAMLLPAFLPFNLLKGGLNAGITLLVYKPLVGALRKARLLPEPGEGESRAKTRLGVVLAAVFVIVTCGLFILALQGVI